MTDDDDRPGKETDEDIIAEAKKRFTECEEWEATARNRYEMDMKFGNADAYNRYQWTDTVLAAREDAKKPVLTINKTQQHCNQIVNDARQNKAGIEVRPTGGGASVEGSDVLEGIVRHIEYVSRAQTAYDTATYNQVYGGWGYCRVLVDYADDDSFDQDIFIKRVADPMSIYLDKHIQQHDGSDARYGFVFKQTPREVAKQKYLEFADEFGQPPIGGASQWDGKDEVTECEYFRAGEKTDELILLPDEFCQVLQVDPGTTVRKSTLPKELAKAIPKDAKRRKISETAIEWFLIVGNKIVDRKPWAGKYIPIARCIGQETIIDGVLDRKGHVRCLIDGQRMYNYQASEAVAFVALQTKTPWVGPLGAFEGLETYWNTANTQNHAWLPYNTKDADGVSIDGHPTRTEPPVAAQGHLEGMRTAESQMMLASGQYQAVMGAPSNETSGKAINARQRQGDNATYHFIDHQAQMVAHIGRIVLDLIPKIYDTPRVIKILCPDQTQMSVQIDPDAQQAHQQVQDPEAPEFDPQRVAAVFNPSIGKYDVIADVGPSYATGRQEAFNAFSQVISQNPDAFHIVGDLWADAADFPGAEVMAKRLKNMLPPQAAGGPPPEVTQMQQTMEKASQAALDHINGLEKQVAELTTKLTDKTADLSREQYEAETKRLAVIASADPDIVKIFARTEATAIVGHPIMDVMAAHKAAEQAMQPPPQMTPQPVPQGAAQ